MFGNSIDAERLTYKEAGDGYNEQPVIKDVQAWAREAKRWIAATDPVWTASREDVVAEARSRALSTHAVVKDGVWYEKGAMGMWAVVHDEIDGQEWESRFSELLESLPDATRLTIVDCHI